jgi:hypothetical protein
VSRHRSVDHISRVRPCDHDAHRAVFRCSTWNGDVSLAGIPVTLTDTQIAATYVGSPATNLANGLMRGFISEADANATVIPNSFPLVGGQALSVLFPGGDPAGPGINCASWSDKDTNNGVVGWWTYLNFSATQVPFTDPYRGAQHIERPRPRRAPSQSLQSLDGDSLRAAARLTRGHCDL